MSKSLQRVLFSFLILTFTYFTPTFLLAKTYYHHPVVLMYDDYFCPSTVTVSPGERITWINMGKAHHTVTSPGYFTSGHIPSGGKITYAFNYPGVYYYRCSLHSIFYFGMTGKVIVR